VKNFFISIKMLLEHNSSKLIEHLDNENLNEDIQITGSGALNLDSLSDITKIRKYCSKNKDFSEKFELLEYIDKGSESVVCKASLKLNEPQKKKNGIIKIILNRKKQENKNELKIATKLKNKNIINFYNSHTIIKDESWCIFMENAHFGNLLNLRHNILKRDFFSESMICFLSNQILNSLIYCHNCKIAHMDVKPKNIVVDNYFNTKLIDFSISINYKGKKPSDSIKLPSIGTSLYMPLEVISSQRVKYKDLNKVDLYSFGVVIYILAFGKYPYELSCDDQDNHQKIYEKIFLKNIGINIENKYFSLCFYDFLTKILEKDINKRISIYEAQNHYWIKGAKILEEEMDNLNNINKFVKYLICNHIKKFNDYKTQYA